MFPFELLSAPANRGFEDGTESTGRWPGQAENRFPLKVAPNFQLGPVASARFAPSEAGWEGCRKPRLAGQQQKTRRTHMAQQPAHKLRISNLTVTIWRNTAARKAPGTASTPAAATRRATTMERNRQPRLRRPADDGQAARPGPQLDSQADAGRRQGPQGAESRHGRLIRHAGGRATARRFHHAEINSLSMERFACALLS